MTRIIVSMCFSFLLFGCTTTQPQKYDIKQTEFRLVIIPNTQDFISGNNPATKAEAHVKPGECVIRLKRYPQCLLHEIRHCVEGNWHEGRNSTEDCHTEEF